MWIEGDGDGLRVEAVSVVTDLLHDSLVTPMHTVEIAYSDDRTAEAGGDSVE